MPLKETRHHLFFWIQVTPGGMGYSLGFRKSMERLRVAPSRFVIVGSPYMANTQYPANSAKAWAELIQQFIKVDGVVSSCLPWLRRGQAEVKTFRGLPTSLWPPVRRNAFPIMSRSYPLSCQNHHIHLPQISVERIPLLILLHLDCGSSPS